MKCKYCSKLCKNENSLRNHERLCGSNPDRQTSNIHRFKKENPTPWNKGKTGVQVAWNKGKMGTFTGRNHSTETKIKMSKSKRDLYESGWESTAGRCKKLIYVSDIAGEVKIDGSWELAFCKYADRQQLNWVRNKKRFSYVRPDGKHATYQPDFYIKDYNVYVEVKGYETDLDRAKWSQFPDRLVILRKKDIQNLEGAEVGSSSGLLNRSDL